MYILLDAELNFLLINGCITFSGNQRRLIITSSEERNQNERKNNETWVQNPFLCVLHVSCSTYWLTCLGLLPSESITTQITNKTLPRSKKATSNFRLKATFLCVCLVAFYFSQSCSATFLLFRDGQVCTANLFVPSKSEVWRKLPNATDPRPHATVYYYYCNEMQIFIPRAKIFTRVKKQNKSRC